MKKCQFFIMLSVFITTVFVLYCTDLPAQDREKRHFEARVKLEISIKDSNDIYHIEDQVTRYISKELKSLGNVVFVEEDPQWTISIAILPVDANQGQLGWAISVVFLRRLLEHPQHISLFKEEHEDMGIFITKHAELMGDHLLALAKKKSLREKCKEIVIFFDQMYLEPARKNFEW